MPSRLFWEETLNGTKERAFNPGRSKEARGNHRVCYSWVLGPQQCLEYHRDIEKRQAFSFLSRVEKGISPSRSLTVEKIKRITLRVTGFDGEFLTLVELWHPKGAIEIIATCDDSAIFSIGGMQLVVGHNCTHVQVS